MQTIDLGNAASGGGFAQQSVGGAFSQDAAGGYNQGRSSESYYSQNYNSAENSRETANGHSQTGQGYRRQWHTEGRLEHSGTIPPTFLRNTLEEGDNVPHDTSSRRSARSRSKRQVDPYIDVMDQFRCNSTKCRYIRCEVTALEKDKEIAVALRSRLNVRAIRDVSIKSTYFYVQTV